MRFNQFKLNPIVESLLTELDMSPGALKQWANSPATEGMLMGIEFEMCVPPIDSTNSLVNDFSHNPPANNIQDLVEWYWYWYDDDRTTFKQYLIELKQMYRTWADTELQRIESGETYNTELIRAAKRKIRAWVLDDATKIYDQKHPDFNPESYDAELWNKITNDLIEKVWNEEPESRESAISFAKSRIRDAFIATDVSERTWLTDELGINKYSDAMEVLEWPWPAVMKPGANIPGIAEAFKTALGLSKVNYSTQYHGAKREEGIWSIETDSSINVNGKEDIGLEFISPAQPIEQALDNLEKIYKWAKDNKCYTNTTTGLHMNISVPNFSVEKLDYIKLAIFSGDRYVLEQFGRLSNSYCNSATKIIKQHVDKENAKQVLEKMRSSMNAAASKLIHSGQTDKYTSINTKHRYVEFRGPGGDYLNKQPEQLVSTLLRLAIALSIACDDNAYRKEYAKKLYKLIAPQDSDNTVVDLFSKYSSGQLSRDMLTFYLERIQTTRDAKKRVVAKRQQRLSQGLKLWEIIGGTGLSLMTVEAASEHEALVKALRNLGARDPENTENYNIIAREVEQ